MTLSLSFFSAFKLPVKSKVEALLGVHVHMLRLLISFLDKLHYIRFDIVVQCQKVRPDVQFRNLQ